MANGEWWSEWRPRLNGDGERECSCEWSKGRLQCGARFEGRQHDEHKPNAEVGLHFLKLENNYQQEYICKTKCNLSSSTPLRKFQNFYSY